MTKALVELINRQRSKGYDYDEIESQLVKMGNSVEVVKESIAEYQKEMCGA